MSALMWLSLVSPCWLPAAQPEQPGKFAQTITFVQKLQTKSGGFLPKPAPETGKVGPPTLRATSAGVRALKYLGGKVPDKEAAAKFVASCHNDKSGGFADVPDGKTDVFT